MGLRGSTPERAERHWWAQRLKMADEVGWWNSNLYVFRFQFFSYIASQSLKTCKNNYLMRWVNVWLFLSAPSIKQPLCNSFYSLRTSLGGVTSTLVLHPLDLIKIRFQGKILGITWFCVSCKCLSNRKSFPCLHSLSVYIRLCKHRKNVF